MLNHVPEGWVCLLAAQGKGLNYRWIGPRWEPVARYPIGHGLWFRPGLWKQSSDSHRPASQITAAERGHNIASSVEIVAHDERISSK